MRKADRIAVDEPARLHPNEWSSLEVRLLDISESGFRAACEARVKVGFAVTLEVPGFGPAKAFVTWCRDREFGAQFVEPLPLERVAFSRIPEEKLLARLLVQRAAAYGRNFVDHEERLRGRILRSLPIRKAV